MSPRPRPSLRPGKVPVPGREPRQQQAIVPTAPQPEKKKVAAAEAKDGAKAGNTYKVASGESLIAIAKKNGVTVESLRAANGLTSNAVRAGQELKIPAAGQQKVAEKPATEKVTADDIKTASVPSEKPADAASKPKAPLAPAATASKESVSRLRLPRPRRPKPALASIAGRPLARSLPPTVRTLTVSAMMASTSRFLKVHRSRLLKTAWSSMPAMASRSSATRC